VTEAGRGARGIPRVAIVGGGPGGLFTAYRLQCWSDRPLDVVILEASERLGGKVRTGRFEAAPVRYEIGAAELYDVSPVDEDPLKDLVRELGLPVTGMAGQAVELGGRILANLDDLEGALGAEARREVLRFDRRARGRMSPRQFYDADLAESFRDEQDAQGFMELMESVEPRVPGARRYLDTLLHSDLATEAGATNLRYGLQNYLMNDADYMLLYSVDGGNERIIEELVRRTRMEVRLGTRVERVRGLAGGGFGLGLAGGEELRCDHAVLALPQPQLAALAFEGETLGEDMREHLAHHDHPAHYLRVSILFERPFWRGVLNESFLMLEAFGGCCLYDESSRTAEARYGVLGWLMGGAAAVELDRLSDEELVAAALDSLPPALAGGRDLVMEAKVHRWIGSVSALPGGRQPRPITLRHTPSPAGAPDLHLVGDYLYDSTLNGVLEAAETVAHEIVARMAAR
jgi:protoporphyrinogen oxidase